MIQVAILIMWLKNNKIVIKVGLFYILTLMACKATIKNPVSSIGDKNSTVEQQRRLDNSVDEVVTDWIDLQQGDWGVYKEQGIDISEKDLANLKTAPLIVYTIDSAHVATYKKGESVGKLISIDSNKGFFYVKKGGQIVAGIMGTLKDGKWQNLYSGPFPEALGSSIARLTVEGKRVVYVCIERTSKKTIDLIAFYEGKNLMSIRPSGEINSIEEDILLVQERIKNPKIIR